MVITFDAVVNVGCCAVPGVHQTGMNVHADVGLVRAWAPSASRSSAARCPSLFGLVMLGGLKSEVQRPVSGKVH